MALVLIVEDDDSTRSMMVRLVMRQGFAVDAASEGNTAMAKLAARDYDVIVLDYKMPQADGGAVIDFIRRERPHLVSRVIVCSGLLRAHPANQLWDGVHKVISKPFEVADLLSSISRCVESDLQRATA